MDRSSSRSHSRWLTRATSPARHSGSSRPSVRSKAPAKATAERASHILALGGDHTIALPLLRAASARFGPLALVHFDAHLDTWNVYFGGARYTHGTPFRRAAEEGLLDLERSFHVGTRGPQFSADDLPADAALGFRLIDGRAIDARGRRRSRRRFFKRSATHTSTCRSISTSSTPPSPPAPAPRRQAAGAAGR